MRCFCGQKCVNICQNRLAAIARHNQEKERIPTGTSKIPIQSVVKTKGQRILRKPLPGDE